MDHLRRYGRSLAVAVALAALALLLALPAGASAKSLGKGQATVRLDPFFAALVGGGYPSYPVAPATAHFGIASTPALNLPVTGGNWDVAHARGTFSVKGGVDYIHYTTGPLTLHQLAITAWHAKVNQTTGWTASANGSRIAVFDENLTASHTSFPTIRGQKYVKVSGVALTYDPAFITAFFGVFGITLPTATPFGTATLLARLK
ncbi:MAG: hypothetical protein ACXVP1_03030 [Thermoleophilia bacterium]